MAIPTFEDVKAAVVAKEIEPFEAEIIKRLESEGTVAFSDNADIADKTLYVTFKGKVISEAGIEALETALDDAGYEAVSVVNQLEPKATGIGANAADAAQGTVVVVTFTLPAAPTPTPPGPANGGD